MIIIGGLMEDDTRELKEGIPWLQDLPLVGRIFTHKSTVKQKSELVILLRPIVVDNNTWSEKTDETFEKIRKLHK
jgi:MSHA biogenesis protein MshL